MYCIQKGWHFMNLNLMKTLKNIEKKIAGDRIPKIEDLEKAYEHTLRLRSQLISVIYDIQQYVDVNNPKVNVPIKTTGYDADKNTVVLTISEPLPAIKEFTAAVEEHWIEMIHAAIAEASKDCLPNFEKAFVMIEITTPRGTANHQVWDTSNRAINVIINNLKGIFFRDDDFEHMAFGITAEWGENAKTVIKICEFDERFKANLDVFFEDP